LLVEFHGMLQTTSLSSTAAGSLLLLLFFLNPSSSLLSQLGTCFKQLSETLQANQEATAAAAACARSKLSELGEGLT
jgi:hypothetical protein